MIFLLLVILLMSGCCDCQQKNKSTKICLLFKDLNHNLKAECMTKVIDFTSNSQASLEFHKVSWRCPEQMLGTFPFHRNVCLELRHECLHASRRLIDLSQIPNHQLKKIHFEYCSLNMIFIYFGSNVTSSTNIDKYFNDVYISVNCRFLFVQETFRGYQFWEIYRENKNSSLHFMDIGQWDEYNRNFSKNPLLPNIYHQRKKFENVTLNVGVLESFPLSTLITLENGMKFTDGILSRCWKLISEQLKIKSIYMHSERGRIEDNGSWSGYLGEIQQGKMQVSLPSMLRFNLLEVMDFLSPLNADRYMVFIRNDQIPKLSAIQWTAFIKPFGTALWICICVIIFCFVFVEFILYSRSASRVRFLIEIIFNKLGRLCIQNQASETFLQTSPSGTILLIIFILFSQIINLSYSSCIISFLISPSSTLAFNDLEGLMNFGGYKVHILNVTSLRSILKNSHDPILSRFYNEYIHPEENNLPATDSKIIENFHTLQNYAFVNNNLKVTYLLSKIPFKMVKFPLMHEYIFRSCSIAKHLPYKRYLNYRIYRLLETGINQHITKKLVSKTKIEENESFNSIDIETILFPLVILIIFHFFSFMLLILERIKHVYFILR